MRVGLCGAGSTGKTTIARRVSAQFGIPFLPSVARSVMVDEWGLESEMDFLRLPTAEQDQCQDMMFVRRLQAEMALESFVGDRTLLDHAAYQLLHCGARMDAATVDDMFGKMVAATARLSLLFFLPCTNMIKTDDRFRNGTDGMRNAVDALIRGFLTRFSIKHIIVPPGDANASFAFVDRHMFVWKRNKGETS